MSSGIPRVLHWSPGEPGDGMACGVDTGWYSSDWNRVTCVDCLAHRSTDPSHNLKGSPSWKHS